MNERKKARILDACLEEIETGNPDLQKWQRKYPDFYDELCSLLETRSALASIPAVEMAEINKRQVKMRMLNSLPDRSPSVTKPVLFRLNQQNRTRRFSMKWLAVISIAAVLLSGGGVVYASGDALPGDTLYPVKLWSEDALLAVAPVTSQFTMAADFSTQRIQEMATLIEQERFENVEQALDGYENRTELMTRLVNRISADDPDEAVRLRTTLQEKLQEHAAVMQQIMDNHPEELGEMVQTRMRTMLQANAETRTQLQEQESEALDETDTQTQPGTEQVQNQSQGENKKQSGQGGDGQSGQAAELVSETLQGDQFQLVFRFQETANNSFQLKLNNRYSDCEADEGLISCAIDEIPKTGTMYLYDTDSGILLFQYAYDYSHQFQWGKDGSNDTQNEQTQNRKGESGQKGGSK